MDANKRITELLALRHWSIYRLCREAKINHSTIVNMIHRNNLPTVATLTLVSAGFGISLPQFFAEQDDPAAMSPERQSLFFQYHDVSPAQREAVLHLMEVMASTNQYQKEQAVA